MRRTVPKPLQRTGAALLARAMADRAAATIALAPGRRRRRSAGPRVGGRLRRRRHPHRGRTVADARRSGAVPRRTVTTRGGGARARGVGTPRVWRRQIPKRSRPGAAAARPAHPPPHATRGAGQGRRGLPDRAGARGRVCSSSTAGRTRRSPRASTSVPRRSRPTSATSSTSSACRRGRGRARRRARRVTRVRPPRATRAGNARSRRRAPARAALAHHPAVSSDAMPWTVANSTRPTRSGSPGSRAPSAWPCSMTSSSTEKARSAGGAERAGRVAVLSRPHQLEQRGVLGGEADVRGARSPAGAPAKSSPAPRRRAQLGAHPREPVLRERVEQRLAVGEVTARRAVADADVARELA